MKATVAILSIGMVPIEEVTTVLAEHVREEKITSISLLENMSCEEVSKAFSPDEDEDQGFVFIGNNKSVVVGRDKISQAMQTTVSLLDQQGYDVILLMNTLPLSGLCVQRANLFEPDRITPPLVASIVGRHQMGVILPFSEHIKDQQNKWRLLENKPLYEIANPVDDADNPLLLAGKKLIERGATVIVLDDLLFTSQHQKLLEQQFSIPVLIPNMLVAKLASELLA